MPAEYTSATMTTVALARFQDMPTPPPNGDRDPILLPQGDRCKSARRLM